MEATTRHTPQRRLVLTALKLSSQPLSADEVLTRVRRAARAMALSTVYRNLDLLTERGEIFRLVGVDGVHRFAGAVQVDATFTCQQCGAVERIALPTALDWLQQEALPRQVSCAALALQGRCADCTRKRHRHV